jgi:two-component system, NtrC family, response regulator
MAQPGTLFLDEIGELPLALQVKLPRFLQDHTVERVGGREVIPVNARVVAATNRDLKEGTKTGAFHADLYFRITLITLNLPPLRKREGGIALCLRCTPDAIDALEAYKWPGNVRELEIKIRRAVVMAEGTRIRPEDLEMEGARGKDWSVSRRHGRWLKGRGCFPLWPETGTICPIPPGSFALAG